MRIADFGEGVHDITTIDSFGWYGEDIRTNPNFTPLDFIDMAEEVQEQQTNAKPGEVSFAQVTLIKRQLRMIIHPGDFDTFWRLAKEKRVTPEALMDVMQKVVEYIAARPTVPQSDSSGGRPVTTTTSASMPDEPVSPLTALDVKVAEREMQGRPDLRLALLNRRTELSAQAG